MEASQEGHLELVRYLLEARADVNATTGKLVHQKKEKRFQTGRDPPHPPGAVASIFRGVPPVLRIGIPNPDRPDPTKNIIKRKVDLELCRYCSFFFKFTFLKYNKKVWTKNDKNSE